MALIVLADGDPRVINISVKDNVEIFVEFGELVIIDRELDCAGIGIADGDLAIRHRKIKVGEGTQARIAPRKDLGAEIVRVRYGVFGAGIEGKEIVILLSLIHISEPTRRTP